MSNTLIKNGIIIECCCRIIFELIKGEMGYVKDLENIELVRDDEIVTWVARSECPVLLDVRPTIADARPSDHCSREA